MWRLPMICAYFVNIFIVTAFAGEFEWAQKARERGPSPAAKEAYERTVAEQNQKREKERQKALEQKEQLRRLEIEQAEIDAQYEADQKALQKECGKDYQSIKVGMTLKRATKCYGEFYLHGQKPSKYGTVDYYTRGGTYLYVRKGKIVAWGN